MTDIDPAIVEKAAKAMADNWPDCDPILAAMFRDYAQTALAAVEADIKAEAQEDALQRLGRALFAVDSKHHLNGTECLCGFVGDARKRTQTEHITAAVLEEYRHD